jgi:hypothetical protein
MRKSFKVALLAASFIFFSLIMPSFSYAADYKSNYQIEYNIVPSQNSLTTKVRIHINIINLRSDLYVKNFAISFPSSFLIHNIKASDDRGPITPETQTNSEVTKINLEFSDPQIGRDTQNNFFLEFEQDNLFKANGSVWEVILPTVENTTGGSYRVTVNLPTTSEKKISIAKPVPTAITNRQIVWDNPTTKTIYAVFGESQYYQVELTYNLKNHKITPVYMNLAFPPDTLYQKIYVDKIDPQPSLIYLDEDDNFIGRYFLKPSEKKTVVFSGVIEVVSQPREEAMSEVLAKLESQKGYLLTENQYWKIARLDKIQGLRDASSIHRFVVDTLQYDYDKLDSTKNTRMGADKILNDPHKAVCIDFTDLFVATAREKGILAREIEGYGFSHDPKLRPLSLTSDVLHSWPEYFDTKKKVWVPIDPTWEDTSGIDYFSSFDLNHIVFAIHGKKPDYPLSAGMYKTEDSKDIAINAVNIIPIDKTQINLEPMSIPEKINDRKTYRAKLTVVNRSNVFVRDIPIQVESAGLEVELDETVIDKMAPLQKSDITLSFKAKTRNIKTGAEIIVRIAGVEMAKEKIDIIPYYFEITLKIASIILVASTIFLALKLINKKKSLPDNSGLH